MVGTIIDAMNKKELRSLLDKSTFIRKTNKLDNEIHSFSMSSNQSKQKILFEIGRLRELTFRESGGGTGMNMDIDVYDLKLSDPYNQLIVFNPRQYEIVGAYRYILGRDDFTMDEDGLNPAFASSELFNFNKEFIEDYLPKTIELGRSFIQPKYQSGRTGMFSLANLWDGLGSLIKENPKYEYFLGKVTFYNDYNKLALNTILSYFDNCCKPENPELMTPKEDKEYNFNLNGSSLSETFEGLSREEGYIVLKQELKNMNQIIPPLVNTYMKTSSNLQVFGIARNKHFGNVLETGIMIPIKDIHEFKLRNHVHYDSLNLEKTIG
ncbi:MAG: GNAT family N-acetyltransferase [Patescibacteria group bacterium]|nr:GNAT family N-acetyltransferase [Patescibacteria group bacterium]